MSDANTPTVDKVEGKSLAWTEEAKYQFLLRIVAQFKEEGKTINWNKINMPGRTTKSLQNMWTKINKSVAELEENGGSVPSTPTKTPTKNSTPRKPRAKKAESVVNEDSDGEDKSAIKAAAKKRANGGVGTPKRAKKIKAEQQTEELDDADDVALLKEEMEI